MYTMMKDGFGTAILRRDADKATIPADPGNIDRQAYDVWIGLGNTPTVPPAQVPVAPDGPTLSDWRVGLTLWTRADGAHRIDEVTAKVAALVEKGDALGRIARERLEYANRVERVQLVQLADSLGFSKAEIEESLWRAERVRLGDLSGVWPLPTSQA